jgi:hypothetical protein
LARLEGLRQRVAQREIGADCSAVRNTSARRTQAPREPPPHSRVNVAHHESVATTSRRSFVGIIALLLLFLLFLLLLSSNISILASSGRAALSAKDDKELIVRRESLSLGISWNGKGCVSKNGKGPVSGLCPALK